MAPNQACHPSWLQLLKASSDHKVTRHGKKHFEDTDSLYYGEILAEY